jgi:hypothetical protein
MIWTIRSLFFASLACRFLDAANNPASRLDHDALKRNWKEHAFVMNATAWDDDPPPPGCDHGEAPCLGRVFGPYPLDPAKKSIELKLVNARRTMRGI